MRYYDNLITNNATRFEDRQVSNVRYNGEKVTVSTRPEFPSSGARRSRTPQSPP